MSFEWPKMHKIDEWIEGEITEAVEERITEFYGIEDTNDMTEEQVESISKFREEHVHEYSPLQWGFSNVIRAWEDNDYENKEGNDDE